MGADIIDILLILVGIGMIAAWLYAAWKMDKAVDRYTAELARSKEPSTPTPLNTVDQ